MNGDIILTDRQTDIAIVIPVYNPGKKLNACIKSIIKQSYKNFVCILVDDGSTDGSDKECNKAALKDGRIHVIHQANQGSVEARKNGVFSKETQNSKYVTFVDSDDTLPPNALQNMLDIAESTSADLICGKSVRKWHGISLPQKFVPSCFKEGEIRLYNHKEIINDLYISCFGISNLPVTLWGKLYRTSVITKAMKCETIVKFMGDDLSIMLNVLPLCDQLVILPKTVYNYSIGGNTSRFMPYLLKDFLALYRYKTKMAARYPMPYDVEELMDIELVNIVRSYLLMCAKSGKYSEPQLYEQIKDVSSNQIIRKAAETTKNIELANYIREYQFDAIAESIWKSVRKDKWKDRLKKVFFSI